MQKGCKNLFIALFIVIIFYLRFNNQFVKISVTVVFRSIREISCYKFYFKVFDNYCFAFDESRQILDKFFKSNFLKTWFSRNTPFALYRPSYHRFIIVCVCVFLIIYKCVFFTMKHGCSLCALLYVFIYYKCKYVFFDKLYFFLLPYICFYQL